MDLVKEEWTVENIVTYCQNKSEEMGLTIYECLILVQKVTGYVHGEDPFVYLHKMGKEKVMKKIDRLLD